MSNPRSLPPPTGPEPWLRLPGETSRRFAYFTTFAELGPERSLQKVADAHGGVSRSHLQNLSAAGHWTPRAEAYDDYRTRVRSAERTIKVRKQSELLADLNFGMAARSIRYLLGQPEAALEPRDHIRAAESGTRSRHLVLNGDKTPAVQVNTSASATAQAATSITSTPEWQQFERAADVALADHPEARAALRAAAEGRIAPAYTRTVLDRAGISLPALSAGDRYDDEDADGT